MRTVPSSPPFSPYFLVHVHLGDIGRTRCNRLGQAGRDRCRRSGWGRCVDVPLRLILGRAGRQRAARDTRSCAVVNSSRQGARVARRTFTRRAETVTCAPIFSNRSRMVPQVARSRSVPARAMRRGGAVQNKAGGGE